MSRRSDRDRPLLAGRVKPTRTPPRKTVGPILRLSHHDASATKVEQTVPSLATALSTAVYAGKSLHRALTQFAGMISRLELAEVEVGRHFDQDPVELVQRRLDTLMLELSALCESKAKDGRMLFDGAWATPVIDYSGDVIDTVTLPAVSLATLGSDGIGGRLESLLSQRDNCLEYVGPATVLALLRSAILWIASERERVFRALAEVIEPLVSELEIIEANASALQDSADSDFCASLAEISRLTVLAQQPAGVPSVSAATPPGGLRLSHSDNE